jgi:hypothetical protein
MSSTLKIKSVDTNFPEYTVSGYHLSEGGNVGTDCHGNVTPLDEGGEGMGGAGAGPLSSTKLTALVGSCTFRFEAQRGERVKLRITRLQTGGRRCVNLPQPDLGRLQCDANCTAFLRLYEHPWNDAPPLERDCLCSAPEDLMPFTFVSTAHVVELRFVVTGMNASDDFNNFGFEGSWEFIRTPVCARRQRLSGASGEIRFSAPSRTPEEVRFVLTSSRGFLQLRPGWAHFWRQRFLSNTQTYCEKNSVFWDIKTQFVLHRRHITSPLQTG